MKFKCKQNCGEQNVVLEINIKNNEVTHEVKDRFYFRMFYTEADRGSKILKEISEYVQANKEYEAKDIVNIIESNNEGSFCWIVEIE